MFNKASADEIKAQALQELAAEDRRKRVHAEKERLREARKHLFPWEIKLTIRRRQ